MTQDYLTCVLSALAAALERPVSPEDDFFALGGDSLASEIALTRIGVATGIDLPGWALLDYPRPVDLVEYMVSLRQ